MSFFVKPEPKLNAPAAPPPPTPAESPKTYIDILYNHSGYLTTNNGYIANTSMQGKNIAVIGAGAAGLLAAYQLMKQEANVTIYEASDRVGGRIYTVYPYDDQAAAFELGAMRVPPCEQLFNLYAGMFGLAKCSPFPDPGTVDTRIIYRNQAYPWPAGQNAPSTDLFNNVSTGWKAFAGSTQLQTLFNLLVTPTPENLAQAQCTWQSLVYPATQLGPEQGYSTISFYQGLVEQFVENYDKWGLTEPWTGDDFELFGALGLGSGGFGSLYQVNFAEIIRLVVNGLETSQQFYPGGLGKLIDGFVTSAPDFYRPAVTLGSCIQLNSRVASITNGPTTVTLTDGSSAQFDAVIVATSNRSMQVEMGISDPLDKVPLVDQPTASALRELHLMNSSKLFVLTKNKFWQDPAQNLPGNIQSDTLVRGLYCLDYYPGTDMNGGPGVVLISYTWGDDSTKCLAVKDPEARLQILLNSLRPCASDFVDALTAARDMTVPATLIDWQDQVGYYGAFKLNYAGQDQYNQDSYFQFLKGGPIYLAGEGVGWCGGWIESALQTGMNAACAVVRDLMGQSVMFPNDPTTQVPQYQYGPNLS